MNSWLQDRLENNPEGIFLKFNQNTYTIVDIARNISILQKAFSASGVNQRKKIIIILPNGVELVELMLACFESGVISVPLSNNITNDELVNIVNEVKPDAIITNWKFSKNLSISSLPILCIEELPSIARSCQVYKNNYKLNLNDICTILMTSGTTNSPKAVQLTYNNFQSSCENWNNFLNFNNSDQFLCCLPLTHIGGLAVLVRALIYGFSINLSKSFSSELIYQLLSKDPITIVSLVPTMLQRIIEKPKGIKYLKSLRAILLGGGPTSSSLLNLCLQENLSIVKTYGMTETCSGIVGLWLKEQQDKKHFAGEPFRDVKIEIKNKEIIISGPMVMKGYLNNVDCNGVHNSHDFGWLDSEGTLFLDMRRKDLIVTGGKNVNPKEVEDILISIDGISDAAVIGVSDDEWGQKVTAYVVVKNKNLSNNKINNALEGKISKFKIPKKIHFVDFIPRNELGKIIYSKI